MNMHPTVVTEATLEAFSEAWNRHDIAAIMSFMSDDCVFETPSGPEACGSRHVGHELVRKAFAAVWEAVPDARWGDGRYLVKGDVGISQWRFTGTNADGSRIDVDGVDVFTFKDGKIQRKNAYRKARMGLATVGQKSY